MGKRPKKTFDNDGKENNKIRALQQELKEKEKHIKQLQSELKTLNKAFEKSANYMSKESKQLTVEELISAANKDVTLEEAKKSQVKKKLSPPSDEELAKSRADTLERIKAWREKTYGKYEEE